MFAQGETESRKYRQSELEMDIWTLIFGNGLSASWTPDVRSYQSPFLSPALPKSRALHTDKDHILRVAWTIFQTVNAKIS